MAFAAVAVPLTAAVSVILFMPRIYQANVTVLVDRQQVPESLVQPTVTSALETRLQTISREILSRSRLEALIERFQLYPDLIGRLPLEDVIERMRAAIDLEMQAVHIKGGQATVAFTLSYRGTDPDVVALVANTLASFYVEEDLKVRERQATGTAEFLGIQLAETKARLDEQERRVSEFRRRHLGELPQQMEMNLATLERLRLDLRLNADNQTRALERRNALESQLAEARSLASPSGAVEPPEARLTRLHGELTRLRTRYTEKHPDVIATMAEVAALERQLAATDPQPAPGAEPRPRTAYELRLREALRETEAEAKILKEEELRLKAAIASYQQRVERTPQREQEFKELARDYDTTRELYQSLLKRHEEAQIAESMEQHQKGEQFRILDAAVPPRTPVANRLRLLAIAVVLSLGLGVAAVALAEHLDTSFHSADDLRRFSTAPVLVSIPWILTAADRRRQRARRCMGMALGCLGLVALVGASYVAAHGNEQVARLLARGSS